MTSELGIPTTSSLCFTAFALLVAALSAWAEGPTSPSNLATESKPVPQETADTTCAPANFKQKRSDQELAVCLKERPNDFLDCRVQALCSANSALRASAIAATLSGMENMTFDVLPATGDTAAAEELSKLEAFSLERVSWNKTGISFSGVHSGRSGGGQITGDRLTAKIPNLLTYFDKTRDREDQKYVECTVSVKLNKTTHDMEGDARCSSVKSIFKARFGFN